MEQFQKAVDLRGCTYDRIQVDWRSLLRRRDGNERINPYDRQPYARLEKIFRAVGQDRAADKVYLERRRVERQRMFIQAPLSWLGDLLYKWIANYGVRPYRLIFFRL